MEIWKPVVGYEDYYEVSNKGRVRSKGRPRSKRKILSPNPTRNGYLTVMFCTDSKPKRVTIHRLVSTAFIDNPNNETDVNHKDGDKTNNSVENLEWVSRSYNVKHAYNNGLHSVKGKKCVCVETGRVFQTTVEAEKWVGIKPGNCKIQSVCNHRKGAKTCAGYRWEWVE